MYCKTGPSLIFDVLHSPVSFIYLLQVMDENNVLQDGTLIDLCGATFTCEFYLSVTDYG